MNFLKEGKANVMKEVRTTETKKIKTLRVLLILRKLRLKWKKMIIHQNLLQNQVAFLLI